MDNRRVRTGGCPMTVTAITATPPTATPTEAMVLTEVDAEACVATVTLNRREKRNALSLDLMSELTGVFRELGARRDVAVVILAANGPAFHAGHGHKDV